MSLINTYKNSTATKRSSAKERSLPGRFGCNYKGTLVAVPFKVQAKIGARNRAPRFPPRVLLKTISTVVGGDGFQENSWVKSTPPHTSAFHSRTRPRPATHKAHRAPTTPQLSSRFDSRATHALTRLSGSLTSMPFGCVLVRVRVLLLVPCGARRFLSTRTHTMTHTPELYDSYEHKPLTGFILINKQSRCCKALSSSHKAQHHTS